jgi:3-hydroxybutyrate dehydrogenase
VTSNCVAPAYVRTPLVENQVQDQARSHGLTPDEVLEQVILGPTAIKRLIEPGEVAAMVGYLCSPPASFVTGTTLVLDGGWTAH